MSELSQTKTRVWFLILAVDVTLVAIGVVVARTQGLPTLAPIVVFGFLFAFAEHQYVLLAGDRSVSAGFMLGMASIVVFRQQGTLLGPLLVGVCGGILIPHLRSRDWQKILFNCGLYGLSVTASAAVYWAISNPDSNSVVRLLLASVPSALAFSCVDLCLLIAVISLSTDAAPKEVFSGLRPSYVQIYPFALLGLFLGRLYLEIGAVIVPLIVVPIIIARQTFASYLELKSSQEAMVRTLIKALEAKDPYTSGHAERVAVYAQYMGEAMSFGPRRMERLRFAALMHDIGKLVVPNHILNKPGKLTEEEYARVRQHEAVSVEVLRRIDFLRPVAPSASGDFSRYEPDAKKHPIEPYIVHTADAYDAMTSTRSYRKALTQQVAFDELVDNSGTQFHPTTVNALINAIRKRDEHHGAGYEQDVHDWVVAPPDAGVGSAGLGDLAPDDETDDRKLAP